MSDVFKKKKRSWIMSRIRSAGNKSTEEKAIRAFRSEGITGWRRSRPLEGRPDFIFRESGVAVFIDGCFWHHCPRHGLIPKSNRQYWKAKMEGNKKRDKKVSATLRRQGWKVVRIWECQLKDKIKMRRKILRLQKYLNAKQT